MLVRSLQRYATGAFLAEILSREKEILSMNTVSPGKIGKLAVKKIVFPALFGLVALAPQMMGPVPSLYAQGGTVSLQAKVVDQSIYCVSLGMNSLSQKKVHIHQKPSTANFSKVTASPGDSGTIAVFDGKDHTCSKNDAVNTISITIPASASSGSTCTIALDKAALTAKTLTPDCQQGAA
jgi:hypothetical protein